VSPLALRALQFVKEGVEPLVALFPVVTVVRQPFDGFAQGRRFEAARATLRVAVAGDQARSLEHFEMLGDGRLADRERRRQLGDGGIATPELGQDRPTGRVGQRGERPVEAVGIRQF
jgi:hypothetical protein